MTYQPLTTTEKQEWIKWLNEVKSQLESVPETRENQIFSTEEGDVATAKDLVDTFLATLTNQTISIN